MKVSISAGVSARWLVSMATAAAVGATLAVSPPTAAAAPAFPGSGSSGGSSDNENGLGLGLGESRVGRILRWELPATSVPTTWTITVQPKSGYCVNGADRPSFVAQTGPGKGFVRSDALYMLASQSILDGCFNTFSQQEWGLQIAAAPAYIGTYSVDIPLTYRYQSGVLTLSTSPFWYTEVGNELFVKPPNPWPRS